MILRALVTCVAFSMATAFQASAEFVRDGFRGHEWGVNASEMPDLLLKKPVFGWQEPEWVEVKNDGDDRVMSNLDTLAGIHTFVWLNFYNARFYGVECRVESQDEENFRKALIRVYGKPKTDILVHDTAFDYSGEYVYRLLVWDDEKTYREFKMDYRACTWSDMKWHYWTAEFEMYSKEIKRQIEIDRKRQKEEEKRIDSIKIHNAKDDF